MFRTYKSELIDKQLIITDENELKERKNVANWLEAHTKWDICKYDSTWKKPNTVSEVFYLIKDSIEIKLPQHQRASTWREFLNKVTDIKSGRPITKLEEIAISYMKKTGYNSPKMTYTPESPTPQVVTKYVEIMGSTDNKLECGKAFDGSSKLTQFIYFGSRDETNKNMGIVKTIFSDVRDQEFEQEWYTLNDKAKLYCIKNEFHIPFSEMAVWEKREVVYPAKKNFVSYVHSIESNKSRDKIEKYIQIAVNQLDEYFELDEIDRKLTITNKFVDYMKKFMDTNDDKMAIEELKKNTSVLGKRTNDTSSEDDAAVKKRRSTIPKTPDTLDYSNDMEVLDSNRQKWNQQKSKGYRILQETNDGFAPYGYNEDFSERIAPHGFVDNDPSKRVRLKGSRWNK